MIKVNGEYLDIVGKSLWEYLSENDYDIKRIAIELNEQILPRSLYEETILKNGDTLEVVSFVGGG